MNDGQAVFVRTGEVGGVVGVAENVAILILAIDPSARVIRMLPLCTGQTRRHYLCLFLMPGLLAFDQKVGNLTG